MRWSRGKCKGHEPIPTTGWKSVPIHIIAECGTGFQPVVCIDVPTIYPFLGRDRSFMQRNVAQSTKSCAARISTEPLITPCGGIAIPTAAKRIAAENDAIHIYFFIGIVFLVVVITLSLSLKIHRHNLCWISIWLPLRGVITDICTSNCTPCKIVLFL